MDAGHYGGNNKHHSEGNHDPIAEVGDIKEESEKCGDVEHNCLQVNIQQVEFRPALKQDRHLKKAVG